MGTKQCEEIKIKVPWGYLTGKWHGSMLQKPILALHGWQDNAGTFDTLIPLLPPKVSVLAIELPGHGFSSQIPPGLNYHASDFLFVILIIMNEYNWSTVSLLGHSLGAIMSFEFAALFPEKIDLVILLDALKPHIRPAKIEIDIKRSTMEKSYELFKRNGSTEEPPSYTYGECVDKLYEGSFRSVTKDYAKYLLNRNLKQSEKYPNKYYFLRDIRLKVYEQFQQRQDISREMGRRIRVPFMMIKAHGENTTYYEEKKYFYEIIDLMKKYNRNFVFKIVPGTHHVHLCEPEKVAKLINPFIEKFFKIENQIKNKL